MTRTAGPETSNQPIPVVNIGWIHPFLEILGEIGVPCDELLERANLPTLAVDDGSLVVPTAKIYEFVALARHETGISDLGLRAGSRFEIAPLLPDAERTWMRPGVFRSIESFIDVALESSSNVDMWIESKSDPAKTTEFFYLGTFGPDHPAFQTVEQFMVALMVRWTRYGAGPKWNPARVNLRSARVPCEAIRRLAGDAEVRCGQAATSIVFPSQQFSGPMERFPERGSAVWTRHRKRLARWDETEDLAGSLRVVLRAYLPDGSPNIEQAARLTGTSVRTLQRRLKEQGISYSQLLEDLRHDLAIFLLRDRSRRVTDIARELGYRDPAIFTRAFRRWTGLTPSQYRQT
jgi:AraC-like DNA-binding protein